MTIFISDLLVHKERLLTVGACLTCHKDNSKTMKKSLIDFKDLLKEITKKCILPEWD